MQVDSSECGRELTQIGGGGANQTGELAEGPVCRRDCRICAWQDQGQSIWVTAVRLDMDERALHHPRPAAFGAVADRVGQLGQGEVALVGRTREPLRRDAADLLAPVDIDLVTAAGVTARIEDLHIHGTNLHDGRRRPLLQPSTRHGKQVHSLTLSRALRGSRPAEGVGRDQGLGRRGRPSPSRCGCGRWSEYRSSLFAQVRLRRRGFVERLPLRSGTFLHPGRMIQILG